MGSQITEGLGQAWAMVATFVPKLLAAVATLLLLGSWMLTTLGRYAIQVISNIPDYL